MAVTAKLYGTLLQALWAAGINYSTDTIKALIYPSTYTPDQDAHQYRSSVTEISTIATTLSSAASAGATSVSVAASIGVGNAITIGGNEVRVVTSVTGSGPYTLNFSGALNNGYASGAAVQANAGYTAGGATLASKSGAYTAGTNTYAIDAADLSWPSSSINGRGVVLYKSTGSAATDQLIGYIDGGADTLSVNGSWSVTFDAAGIATITAA
jgi:hypothetical protein